VQDQRLVCFTHSKLLLKLGKLRDAERILRQLHREASELKDDLLLAKVLNQQALLAKRQNDFGRALSLHREQHHICERAGDVEERLGCRFNQAVLHTLRNETTEAERLLAECERGSLAYGVKSLAARCLHETTVLNLRQGRLEHAEELLAEKERKCEGIGDKRALSTCCTIQAEILRRRNDDRAALRLLERKTKLCQETRDFYELAIALNNRAAILAQMPGGTSESRHCLVEAYGLARRHGFIDLASRLRK
jgi:hypothetical protein